MVENWTVYTSSCQKSLQILTNLHKYFYNLLVFYMPLYAIKFTLQYYLQ